MAEHFHAAGFTTASFTTNPSAGRMIGMERGVDVLRDGGERHGASSAFSTSSFRQFREQYPSEPYWVHFQTTDVHFPYPSTPPFAGLYVTPEHTRELREWDNFLFATPIRPMDTIFSWFRYVHERFDIDSRLYYERQRGLYDETMAQQDYHLGRFVERLKANGEWENTLLVIGSDHGHPAGSYSRFGRGLLEPQPEDWEGALLGAYNSRIPLMFIWTGPHSGGTAVPRARFHDRRVTHGARSRRTPHARSRAGPVARAASSSGKAGSSCAP